MNQSPSPRLPAGTQVAVVTGMSGAGRSTASWALEDLDWFVIDNLPPSLVSDAVAQVVTNGSATRVGVVADIRAGVFFEDLAAALDGLRAQGANVTVVFLDAADDVLVRRFEYARRPHPLQGEGTILDGITAERARIAGLRAAADMVIDTGALSPHDLRSRIVDAFAAAEDVSVHVSVQSFGFKFGLPADADMVFDVRFVPNPHWDPALRPLSGQDAPVRDAVMNNPLAAAGFEHILALVSAALPGYVREGKRYVSIAIGCTGGRHRSVAVAEELARGLSVPEAHISLRHRDVDRQ